MTSKPKRKKPWNKGKIVGGKTALTAEEVHAIRLVLAQKRWPARDRLMFAIGVDSSLRGSDLVGLRVADVMLAGQPRNSVTVEPLKTKETSRTRVTFEMRDDTKELLHRYVDDEQLLETDFLFSSVKPIPGKPRDPLSERNYARRVKKWVAAIGLNADLFGTHSIRKVRPVHIYKMTGNIRACQVMLGHKSIVTTQRYLGIEADEAMAISRQFQV